MISRKGTFCLLRVISFILLILIIPGAAFAQDSEPTDDQVNAIAKQLYCPVCENIPLDACGTVACEQWRGIIRDKLREGWTEEEIKSYFVAQYGDRVLAEPPRRGFNWLVYAVPAVVFGGGVILLYRSFISWRARGSEAALEIPIEKDSTGNESMDDYIQRVEEELRKRSGGES